MIGRLQGQLIEKNPPELLIDVRGVCYEIFAPMSTFYRLGDLGSETSLHTHLVVREDAHVLYGFSQREERSLFRNLIKVNGIGPKMALAILSGMEAHEFAHCIRVGNTDALVRVPGIGKKTAERLLIEMRDRLRDEVSVSSKTDHASGFSANREFDDAVSALIALGYKPNDAIKAIERVAEPDLTRDMLIRKALKIAVRV